MASRTFQVLRYNIYLGSKMLVTISNKEVSIQAYVKCYGKKTEQFDIYFVNERRPTQPVDSDDYPNVTRIVDNEVSGLMIVPSEQYAWYVDLLRNEEPVWASLDDKAQRNRLYCAGELVGEGELASSTG